MVIADGRRVAESCTGPLRSDLLRLCDEMEILTNQLADLIAKGQVRGEASFLLVNLIHFSKKTIA